MAQKKNIELIVNIEKGATIYGNELIIQMFLMHLTIDFIRLSQVNGSIIYDVSEGTDQFEFSIVCNGIRISKEGFMRLLNVNYESISFVSNELGKKHVGSSIFQEFVTITKGKIWLESEWNKGAILKFTIPK
jgi:signal transduction histidine kinase